MRIPFTLWALISIGALFAQDPDAPNDGSNTDSVLSIESAIVVTSPTPGESAVRVAFDRAVGLPEGCEIHGFGARKFPISPLLWTTPRLVDMNGDDRLDLVIVELAAAYCYLNSGDGGSLLFESGVTDVLQVAKAFREHFAVLQNTLTVAGLSSENAVDFILGDRKIGKIAFFPASSPGVGELPVYPETPIFLEYDDDGARSEICLSSNSYGYHPSVYEPSAQATSTAFIELTGDGQLDLVVPRYKSSGSSEIVFLLFAHAGVEIDPISGVSVPYYAKPVLLKDGTGTVLSLNAIKTLESGNQTALFDAKPSLSFLNIDASPENASPEKELVVSLDTGEVYYAKQNGDGAAGVPPSFSKIVNASSSEPATALRIPSHDSILSDSSAIPIDLDPLTPGIDLLVSEFSSTGPARRLLKIHSAVDSNTGLFDEEDVLVLGALAESDHPLLISTSVGNFQEASSLVAANVNGDQFMDLVQGSANGEIILRLSVDSGNDFDPLFSTPIWARSIDGDPFCPFPGQSCDCIVPVNIDGDDLQIPEGFLLSMRNASISASSTDLSGKIYYTPVISIDSHGCPRLGEPVLIPLPSGSDLVDASAYLHGAGVSIFSGDPASTVPAHGLLTRKYDPSDGSSRRTSIHSFDLSYQDSDGAAVDLAAYLAANEDLSLLRPIFSSAVVINEGVIGLGLSSVPWDFDGDQDIDFAFLESGQWVWRESVDSTTAGPVVGKVVSLIKRAALALPIEPVAGGGSPTPPPSPELLIDNGSQSLVIFKEWTTDSPSNIPFVLTGLSSNEHSEDLNNLVRVFSLKNFSGSAGDIPALYPYSGKYRDGRALQARLTQTISSTAGYEIGSDNRVVTFTVPLKMVPEDLIRINFVTVPSLDDPSGVQPVSIDTFEIMPGALLSRPLDTDGDRIPDALELAAGLNHLDASDAIADFDGDGRSNYEELLSGTSPTSLDTDRDGITDSDEIAAGTDPTVGDFVTPGSVSTLLVLTPLK